MSSSRYVGLQIVDSTNGANVTVDASGTTVTPTITTFPTDTVTFQQPAGTQLVSRDRVDIYYGEYGQPGTYVATVTANSSGTWSWTPSTGQYALQNGKRYFVLVNTTLYSDGIRVSIIAQNVNYQVFYTTPTTQVQNVISVNFTRNVHPRDDGGTLKIAGIPTFVINGQTQYGVQAARELLIYRTGSDGTKLLKFRGMTTNVSYELTGDGIITNVEFSGLWYMLEIRLLKLDGKAPPPFPPNTNPYLIYLNPLLNLNFGTLMALVLGIGFQNSYATGNLPPIAPVTSGTRLDNTVVNDQMVIQYMSIANVIDRLVTSAIFGTTSSAGNEPFVAEVNLDIDPNGDNSGTGIPALSVRIFDPLNAIGQGSKYGVGQNKTGVPIPYGSTDPTAQPVDNINFIEGANIVTWNFLYDYISMGNSWVLTGGSFRGSDVVALPIENPQSIAQFGLKQIQKSLANVVDPDEIRRYIGSFRAFFQRPIPSIKLTPQWNYADSHVVNAGDFITVVSPTLTNNGNGGVLVDNNGNQVQSLGFVSRVKTVSYTWDADNGEQIDYVLMFPIQANPKFTVSPFSFTAPQYMYSSVRPTAETLLGTQTRGIQEALYNTDSSAPIENLDSTLTFHVSDSPFTKVINGNNVTFVAPGYDSKTISMQPQLMNIQTTGGNQDAIIYGFWVTLTANDPSISGGHVRIEQPDGLTIYDDILPVNQKFNLLPLISKVLNSAKNLVNSVAGTYIFVVSNLSADLPASVTPSGFTPTASTVDYVLQIDLAYLINSSNTKLKGSVTNIPQTSTTIDPNLQLVFPPTTH